MDHPRPRHHLAATASPGADAHPLTAKPVLAQAGFANHELDIALGVSYAESAGYADAVGDLTLINEKWGPSIGLFQIRSLRNPDAWGAADRWRVASELRDPLFNAQAAYAIRNNRDWTLWTVYRTGTYLRHIGHDYPIHTGHPNAHLWNS